MRTWHLAEQTREIDFDVVFFLATMALLVLGTVMIFSSSYFVSKELYGNGITMTKKHLFHVVLGTVAMMGIMAVDYRRLCNRRLVLFALAGSALALVLCFVPVIGHSGGHSRRWVGIGPAVVQASNSPSWPSSSSWRATSRGRPDTWMTSPEGLCRSSPSWHPCACSSSSSRTSALLQPWASGPS